MKHCLALSLIIIALSACSFIGDPEPTPTPTLIPTPTPIPIPETFRQQLTRFLERAADVNSATEAGVNYIDFRRLVSDAQGAYDLMASTWPETLDKNTLVELSGAMYGWDLTLNLWNSKIDDRANPTEPSLNRYDEYVAYTDDKLETKRWRSDGRYYITYDDDNIGLLMSIASDYYHNGKDLAIDILQ